jgi:hypothetical protein
MVDGQGAPRKKNDESDVHLLLRLKKSSHLLYLFIYLFYRFFLTRFLGVSQQGEFKNTKTKQLLF